MAEVNTGDSGGGKKGGKTHAKKQSTRIDMTPMVDLAFLLLTFFMLTATFNKPQIMEINMPAPPEPNVVPTQFNDKVVTTILIGKDNRLFYYDGKFDPAAPPEIKKSDYSKEGIRKLLIDKNQKLYDIVSDLKRQLKNKEIVDTVYLAKVKEAKKLKQNNGRIVIVKPEDDAAYENVVNILDEMSITNVVTFALVNMSPEEKALIDGL